MPSSEKNIEIENLLGQLAFILSKNLVTNSFKVGTAQEPLSAILKNGSNVKEERTRNILVIGAGATYNANPGIKLASDAIKIVRSAFIAKYGEPINELIDGKIDELSKVFKLNINDFETQLLACSTLDKKLVIKQLEQLYKLKYPTSLFYEIIAHLFKHRFIDVIINFNFDEILDNAIGEEMFDSQYKYIYSDGHCPDKEKLKDELLYDNRLTFPVYIKPHGTISHPSTLRFTRKAYYETPSKITDTIIYLIQGTIGARIPHEKKLPINLIVAGFGMKSHEFNSIISAHLEDSRAKLFYFDILPKDGNFWDRFKEDNILSFNSKNSVLFPIAHDDYGNRSLDDWFYLLWAQIQGLFSESYIPKGIARHVIVHEVFNPMTEFLLDKSYPLVTYFKDRTLMELAIEILTSSDGLINLRQLKESRVQKYYSLYKKEDPTGIDLFEFLREYNLKRYKGYIKDTWYYDKENTDFIKAITELFKINSSPILQENFNSIKDKKRLFEHRDKLAISKKLFLNIRFTARDNYISIFQKINNADIINTDIKWIYTFRQYFLDSKLRQKWNLILAISETGGIFSMQGVKELLENKKIMLICSFNTIASVENTNPKIIQKQKLLGKKLKDIEKNILVNSDAPELRLLPFRNHNQHIILFTQIDKEKKIMDFVGGIYYGRRNMSKRVTPIHVQAKPDLEELFNVFINYWDRAVKDDNIDIIKEAVINDKITPEIKNLAKSKQKSDTEIKNEIIDIYIQDKTAHNN
jgi:SIR2-like domain